VFERVLLVASLAALALSCGQVATTSDGGDAGTVAEDAGGTDASVDAGADDAGAGDAGTEDAGIDAGPVDAGVPDAGPPPVDSRGCLFPSDAGTPFTVRVVAANLTSGNYQSYDPGEGQRILQGLAPDVVMIQEFNYGDNAPATLQGFVDATFDGGFSYVRGPAAQIPNGVISRWPILASGNWTDPYVGNRGFTWALVDLPGPRELWVVSVHLLTSSAGDRSREAQALVTQLRANVPTYDFLVVGGDFNIGSRSEQCLSDLRARLVVASPYPADQSGVEGTNRNRDKPYDGVYASKCLDPLQVPVAVGAQSFDAGLVFDSRDYTPLADVPPVLATDSAASNMQHMAVVRDFLVAP